MGRSQCPGKLKNKKVIIGLTYGGPMLAYSNFSFFHQYTIEE